MNKGDKILIILIFVVSLIGIMYMNNMNESKEKYIEIVVNNKIYKKIYIKSQNYTEKIIIKNNDNYNNIYIHNGGVEIISASCKDKICVKSGFISKKGQIIACLPNKLYVKILGVEKQIDGATY